MTTTAEAAAAAAHLTKLGLVEGAVVQELGYDDDVDLDLRDRLMEHIGSDLVDAVVDGLTDLDDQGFIVLMTPRAGRDGHVEPAEIAEAATTAGLHVSGALTDSSDWTGTRLVPPRAKKK